MLDYSNGFQILRSNKTRSEVFFLSLRHSFPHTIANRKRSTTTPQLQLNILLQTTSDNLQLETHFKGELHQLCRTCNRHPATHGESHWPYQLWRRLSWLFWQLFVNFTTTQQRAQFEKPSLLSLVRSTLTWRKPRTAGRGGESVVSSQFTWREIRPRHRLTNQGRSQPQDQLTFLETFIYFVVDWLRFQ